MRSTVLPALAWAITRIGCRYGHSCALAVAAAKYDRTTTSRIMEDETGLFGTTSPLS
jgi:methylaspartate ammonia-lyase